LLNSYEGLTTLGEYLKTGSPVTVLGVIERNTEHSRYLLGQSGDDSLYEIGSMSTLVLPQLVRSSIWHNTSRLGEAARQFTQRLASTDRDTPVLELWWAQRQALAQNLLDQYKIAIGVQMPTSAGKTLLAEFAIVQALALNPYSTVAYIVPTRALVNQVTHHLRTDLAGAVIGGRPVTVELAVPVFELDPTEDAMLSHRPDVLVTTPEKLDLLVRSGHTVVRDLAFVVVDEAHHIAEPGRGPTLELLLATLKRERGTSCRFLLLTPFLPNADELARWLGGADHVAISLEWRPSLQLRAVARWRKRQRRFRDILELVPSHTQPAEWQGVEIDLGEAYLQPQAASRPGISASVAASLALSGSSSLILTRGQKTAEDRASEIAAILREHRRDISSNQDVDDVLAYIRSELSADYPLTKTIPYGVAFHHAGLPPEVRALIEGLLAKGSLLVVAGTTTLAQGVNFPLAHVIVETLTLSQGRGRSNRPLQYSEFWNIAGRAGRALKDRIGTVIWPADSPASAQEFVNYLEGEATAVVSALAGTLASVDDVASEYNLDMVRRHPSLSHFLQYLAHALRVGGFAQASAEIEDILRSSLVFYRLRLDDRESAERLVRWSRRFLEANRNTRLLDVADSTGLSLPSVGLIAGRASPEMRSEEFWQPSNLFGSNLDSLTSAIELLSEVPEFSLGLTDEPGGLNASRVAGILRDWVTGASIPNLVRNWSPYDDFETGLRNIGRYIFRELTGQLPWGLGALQLLTMPTPSEPDTASELNRIPAMAYYGVQSRGAVSLRMIGVPRVAAEALGQNAPEFNSYGAARSWTDDLPDTIWDAAAQPHGSSGRLLKRIWKLTEN
jgi:helicase